MTCPARLQLESLDGQPVIATYQAPVNQGGVAPITVSCSPASGASVPVGTTNVTCTAKDAATQTSCSFPVVVLPPPKLQFTDFLAFGDSLTAGVASLAPTILALTAAEPYPVKLRNRIAARYRTQNITIVTDGVAGEEAADGGTMRFGDALRRYRPKVVLLMEGSNDLYADDNEGAARARTIAALDTMIREASNRGVQAFLATLPPQRLGGPRDRVARIIPGFNQEIRSLAQRRGVPLVDVYAAMEKNPSFIGADDLHPTEKGYEVISRTFFNAIKAKLEIPAAVPSLTLFGRQ